MICKKSLLIFSAILMLASCASNKENTADEAAEIEGTSSNLSTAISLGNNVSVRAEPSAKGDRLTALAIGESVTWLDSTVTDTGEKVNYEYALVRLSDGTEGWAVGSYLFQNRDLAAITKPTTIYSRPDLLTSTKKVFQPMDLIVVKANKDQEAAEGEWVEVTGRISDESAFASGWIQIGDFTYNKEEIVVAQLVYKANELKGENRMEELKSIASDPQYKYRNFTSDVRALTFNDPNGFLKEEYKDYYIGMINYYDSSGHDSSWKFDELTGSVEILGRNFHMFKYGEWRENNHWHIWNFFYDFATYAAAKEGYAPIGYYKNYFDISDQLKAMEKLSGMNVYDSYTEEWGDFSRVNEAFVAWVADNLLPRPEDDFLGIAAEKIYQGVFRDNARYTYKQWRLLNAEFDLDDLTMSYEDGMNYENFDAFEHLQETFEGTPIDPVLAGVFMRRKIDDSYDNVVYAMRKAITLYDGEWLSEQANVEPYTYFESEFYHEEEYYEEDEYYEEEYVEEGELEEEYE